MFRKTINPVKRRNSILIMAGIFMAIAVIEKPSLLLFFLSAKSLSSVTLAVFAAFLATLGIYSFVRSVFGWQNSPWYTHKGAMLFIVTVLLGINALFIIFDNLLSSVISTRLMLSQKGYIWLFMAFELLWIVALEWVSYER